MIKRKALGRGLGALLPDVPSKTPESDRGGRGVLELDVELVSPNPNQPRRAFPDESLAELAQSIAAKGVLQPILVRRDAKTGGYQILVGERRWRAAQLAGLHTIPAILHDSSDETALEIALVENIHREDLNPLEEAHAYQLLIERFKLTQEQVAGRVGKKRSSVTNTLRLLRLHPEVQARLAAGDIDMGHARALLSLEDVIAQRELCEEVVKRGLTVRQVEARARRFSSSAKRGAPVGKKKSVFFRDAEQRLSRSLQAPVTIKQRGRSGGGEIAISFVSEGDLQRLFDRLVAGK